MRLELHPEVLSREKFLIVEDSSLDFNADYFYTEVYLDVLNDR